MNHPKFDEPDALPRRVPGQYAADDDRLARRALTAVELDYWLDEFAARAAALVEVNNGQEIETAMMAQVSDHVSGLSRAWAVRDEGYEPDPVGDQPEQWQRLSQIVYGAAEAAMRIAKLLGDIEGAGNAEAAAVNGMTVPVGGPLTAVMQRVAAALREDRDGAPPQAAAANGEGGDADE